MRRGSSRAPWIALLLVAGASGLPAQRPGASSAAAAADTTPAAVVQAYIRAYNAHDVEATVAFLASDFVWLSIAGDSVAVEARGTDAIRAGLREYFRATPTSRSTLVALSALGPWVTAHERAEWVSASGPRAQASVSVYEVRGGLLRRVWYYPVVREPPPAPPR